MNKLLNNGITIPMIGLGTYLSKGNECYEAVKYALMLGIRHIDTAQMYKNHKEIGLAIKDSKVPREEIFITTKQMFHMSLSDQISAFNQTLEDLQTDYIDLYLIHWPNHDLDVNLATWRYFETLVEEKKVRSIGVSNFTEYHLEHLLKHAKIKPVVNQVELHPGLTQIPLQGFLAKHNIAIESYGPFMKGEIFSDNFSLLKDLSIKYNCSVAQLVIAYLISREIIAIPKSINKERIKENFQAKDIKISNDDILLINSLNIGKRVYTDPSNSPWGPYKKYLKDK